MEDWDLIRKYRAGEKGAMDELVRRHVDMVYSVACRSAGTADADDVTQAVFLLLSRRAGSIPTGRSVAGWLYRATRLCAANLRKSEGRRRKYQKEAGMQRPSRGKDDATMEWKELLDEGLDRLREKERTAVLLRHGEGRSFDECATILGLTAEATRKRANRGLLKLRQFFAARGVALPEAGLTATAFPAPMGTVNAALAAAHGAPVAPHVVALSKGIVFRAAVPKLVVVCGLAAMLAGAFALPWALFRGKGEAALPSTALSPVIAAPPSAATEPALPPVQMMVANPGHPTEQEVRAFLKARLERLSNMTADYMVETEYAEPAGGWPRLLEPLPAAIRSEIMLMGPAAMVARTEPPGVPYPLFPNGTEESRKSFRMLPGQARYESELVKVAQPVPYPDWAKMFRRTTLIAHQDRVDRLFYLDTDVPALAESGQAGLLEPDIELALGLCPSHFPETQTNLGISPPFYGRLTRTFVREDMDEMCLRFPDEDHVLAVRSNFPHRDPIPGYTISDADWRNWQGAGHDEWLLDRKLNYAPVAYRGVETNTFGGRVEAEMSEFRQVDGVMVPAKVVSKHYLSARLDGALWRTDTLTIQRISVQDSANVAAAYRMTWPENIPNDGYATGLRLIGGDTFSSARLSLGNSRQGSNGGSPSEAVASRSPWWEALHASFRERSAKGNVDVLFVGDGLIECWGREKDLWTRELEPLHAANYGLRTDAVENVLWRVTHGELEGLSPKVIVLLVGSVDAGSLDETGPQTRPMPASSRGPFDWPLQRMTAGNAAISMTTSRRRSDTPEQIVAGFQTLLREVRARSPGSKILLLGIPPQGTKPSIEAVATIRSRITSINKQLQTLDDGATVRFLDLAGQTTQADGTLPPDDFVDGYIPKTKVYDRWTQAILPLLKEMMK